MMTDTSPPAPARGAPGVPAGAGPRRHHLARALAVCLVGALAGGCAGATTSSPAGASPHHGAASAGTLTLYSGQHEQTTEMLVSAFERATGIRVAVRYEDEDTFANEIVMEASHPSADVFYTENSPPLEYLQSKHLLAGLPAATLDQVPARYGSPRGDWAGISARVSVLVYDPARLAPSQLPRSVLQLARPRYRGELALAPGETDFQPVVTSVALAFGRARAVSWLEGLKANAAGHVYSDNETVTTEVNRGVAALGVVNQYYWYRLRAEVGAKATRSRIAFFAPRNPGYVVDISGAAVLRYARHKAAAQRFVAFLVSKAGQEILARSQSFEYPLAHGVAPAGGQVPFSRLRPYPVTVAQLGDGAEAISLMQQAGLL